MPAAMFASVCFSTWKCNSSLICLSNSFFRRSHPLNLLTFCLASSPASAIAAPTFSALPLQSLCLFFSSTLRPCLASRSLENEGNRRCQPVPLGFLFGKLLASRLRQGVVLRTPIVFRRAPFGL